jgi:hypothetical protein
MGASLSLQEKRELFALLTEQERRRSLLKWLSFYPADAALFAAICTRSTLLFSLLELDTRSG